MEESRQQLKGVVAQLKLVRDQIVSVQLNDAIAIVHARTETISRLLRLVGRGTSDPPALTDLVALEWHLREQIRIVGDQLTHVLNDAMDDVDAMRRPIVRVASTSPEKRRLLRRPPDESIVVVDDAAHYLTDERGRVIHAGAIVTLVVPETRRNRYAERTVRGKLPGDHAGHLLARILGGVGHKINLVPMASSVNLGVFATLERRWRKAVAASEAVHVTLTLRYDSDGRRPSALTVNHMIGDRHPETVVIENPLGKG